MDVNYILSRAESICLQMQQQAEDLPNHIKDLINLPENITNGNVETDPSRQNINNDDNNKTDENNIACNSSDIKVQNKFSDSPSQQQQQQQQQQKPPSTTTSNHDHHGDREAPSGDEVVELIATAHSVF